MEKRKKSLGLEKGQTTVWTDCLVLLAFASGVTGCNDLASLSAGQTVATSGASQESQPSPTPSPTVTATATPTSVPWPTPTPSPSPTPSPTSSPAPQPLSVTPSSLFLTEDASASLTATGGTPPYQISFLKTQVVVPQIGLSQPQNYIGSVQQAAGSASAVYRAAQSIGYAAESSEVIRVRDSAGATLDVTATLVPKLKVGLTSYEVIGGEEVLVTASGGLRPYRWEIQSGGGSLRSIRTIVPLPLPQRNDDLWKYSPDIGAYASPAVQVQQNTVIQVTDAGGAVATAQLVVKPRPVQAFSVFGGTMAPAVVHFNAAHLSLDAGDRLTARYEWDFGDPASGTRKVPGSTIEHSLNRLEGWNAAHLYSQPGDYKVRLKITDPAGGVKTYETIVSIVPDSRRKIYVSMAGDDGRDGSSEASAVKSIERAAQLLQDNTSVLLRAGDRFTPVSSAFNVRKKNVVFYSYGSGDKPVLYAPSNRSYSQFIDMGDGAQDVVVQGWVMDSDSPPVTKTKNGVTYLAYEKNAVSGVRPAGVNTAVIDCDFLNIATAVNTELGPRGVFTLGNNAPLETGIRAYFVWGNGSDHVHLGNFVANSTREHILRNGGVRNLNISFNDFSNLSRSQDPEDISKGCIVVQKGGFATVRGNVCRFGGIGVGPLGGDNGLHDQTARWEWAVLEGNRVQGSWMGAGPGASHVLLRNNVVSVGGGNAFGATGWERGYESRILWDFRFLNNTGILDSSDSWNQGRYGNFLRIAGLPWGVQVVNNLYHAPSLQTGAYNSAVLYFEGTRDLEGVTQIANNFWAAPKIGFGGGIHWLAPNWVGADYALGYLDASEWAGFRNPNGTTPISQDLFGKVTLDASSVPLSTLSCLVVSGVPCEDATVHGRATPGVWNDAAGRPRPASGKWSVGAFEPGQ